MTIDQMGQLCALLTAVVWAGALVLFKRSGESVPPLALNLFKNTVGLGCLAVHLLVVYLWTGIGTAELRGHCWPDVGVLMVSGLIGIALADTIFFRALNLIGVGLVSIVDCTYSPMVILCSWLLLSEELTLSVLVGGGLIVSGILVSSRHAPPIGRTRGQVAAGVGLAVLAMALMAVGIVMATPLLKSFPLAWATLLRLLAGTLALAGVAAATSRGRQVWAVFRPARVWRASIPAAVLGTYVSLLLWIAGFKYADKAAVAAVLNQTSVIFALLLASLVLGEAFTRRKAVAVALALTGVVVVTLDPIPALLAAVREFSGG